MDLSPPLLPTFLIIGAQKSGTRWLRLNLGLHPNVMTAPKELEFFNHNFERGAPWYQKQFEGWMGEAQIGESTPGYMMWNETPAVQAARIDGFLPDVRLLAVLRDPVERAYSAFIHHMARGRIPDDAKLLDWVKDKDPNTDPMGLISGGWYYKSLKPYALRFGDRLAVFLHKSIKESPDEVYSNACIHLGVDPSFTPRELTKVRFSQQPPDSNLHARDGRRRKLTAREKSELFSYFEEDIDALEDLIQQDLSSWRPSDLDRPVQSGPGDVRTYVDELVEVSGDLRNTGVVTLRPPSSEERERTLIVLGVGRSGTSMVAGSLHHVGVFMGDSIGKVNFEDQPLSAALEKRDFGLAREIIAVRNSRFDVWGWKRPSALQFLAFVEQEFRNPHFICVFRDIVAIAEQRRVSMGFELLKTMHNTVRAYSKLVKFVQDTDRPTLMISYEKALSNKDAVVSALAAFAGLSDGESK